MIFALLMSVALQAPPAPKAEPPPPPGAAPKPETPPKPETLDEQIKRALVHHPDVRIAQLQVELARAKLEQERQRLTQRITTARAVRDAALTSRDATARLTAMKKRVGGVTQSEVAEEEEKLTLAQEKLAVAEAELVAAVGGPLVPPPDAPVNLLLSWVYPSQRDFSNWNTGVRLNWPVQNELATNYLTAIHPRPQSPAAPGDFRSDFAQMLDQRITPAKKEGNPRELLTELLFKAAGGKPPPIVRVPIRLDEKMWKDVGNHTLQGETDTLGAWLQQLTDAVSGTRQPHEPGTSYTLYVRDYGLLLAPANEAPAGALTVAEFWQRARAEKAAKEKPAPKK